MNAIAAIVNVVATVIHEALGHGLVATFFHAAIQHVSSVDLACDERSLTIVQRRIVAAAGPLVNIITGLMVLLASDRWTPVDPTQRYALWLFGHVSLLVGGGYALALPFAGFGDMHEIVAGLSVPVAWQALFSRSAGSSFR